MLGNRYLHVHNSKITAQVHVYQLCQYKWMMCQAIHNMLHKDTSLHQLFLGLDKFHIICPFKLYYFSQIYGNIYHQTLHHFVFLGNCWLVFHSSHSIKTLPKTFYFQDFTKNLHIDLAFSAFVTLYSIVSETILSILLALEENHLLRCWG